MKPTIICAWAEHHTGAGWSNCIIWYIMRDENGKLTEECLQPKEQTKEMHEMFDVSVIVSGKMTSYVNNKVLKGKKK